MTTEELKVEGFERVVYAEDPRVGLRSIISVHSTTLGPSCGGIRLRPYASRAQALEDALKLSRGMTYKSALAEINFGGGKSVIISDPLQKTRELFQSFGNFVGSLNGVYIAAKDMNVTNADLLEVRKITSNVLGIEGLAEERLHGAY